MFSLDVVFWTNGVKGWMKRKMGLASEGFEDELERSMRSFTKSNFGVDVAPDAFDG
jgi:aarF domain-containing kinase